MVVNEITKDSVLTKSSCTRVPDRCSWRRLRWNKRIRRRSSLTQYFQLRCSPNLIEKPLEPPFVHMMNRSIKFDAKIMNQLQLKMLCKTPVLDGHLSYTVIFCSQLFCVYHFMFYVPAFVFEREDFSDI